MGKLAVLATASASLAITGCVAPLMMAPALISSAMPAMTAVGASTAARSAMKRQQQVTAATNSQTKFQPFWAKKKTDDTDQTASR